MLDEYREICEQRRREPWAERSGHYAGTFGNTADYENAERQFRAELAVVDQEITMSTDKLRAEEAERQLAILSLQAIEQRNADRFRFWVGAVINGAVALLAAALSAYATWKVARP